MGCKAITPHLVGLAKRLENRPFHLVASHCQRNPKAQVVSYIKGQGLPADTPNFTVTSFGRHPGVKGNGYVPYYMVFDHTGKLVRHHMCGAYHGGDGLAMIEWVDKLLKDAPDLYLGEEPFTHVPKLAAQVSARKNLAAAVKQIESRLAGDPGEARVELERLLAAIRGWRDGRLGSANAMIASNPARVLPSLKQVQGELKGTSLVEPVDARLAELKASDELKRAISVDKALRKIVASLEKRKCCKGCKRQKRLKHMDLACPSCRADNKGALSKARKQLEKLIEREPDLPVTGKVREFLSELG